MTGVTLCWRLDALGCREVVERISYAAVRVLQYDLGLMDIMSLHEVETQLKQYGHRVRALNSLRNRLDVSFLRSLDNLADGRLHCLVRHQCVHELTIDLDVVGLKQVENLEPFPIHAVVFERKANAELPRMFHQFFRLLDVLGGIALRYLDDEA